MQLSKTTALTFPTDVSISSRISQAGWPKARAETESLPICVFVPVRSDLGQGYLLVTGCDGEDDHLRSKADCRDLCGEGDVLSEVLAVEREIGVKLDAERQAAAQWLEQTRSEIEQTKLSELTALKASAAREEEAAKMAAHDKAAAILQQAGTEVGRIRRLEDARLIPIVRQHLLIIAGGRAE